MKLVLISSEFAPGPEKIGNHAHQLALNLHRLGWTVAVISPQDYASSEEIEEFNRAQPFNIVRVSSGRGRLREAFCRARIAYRFAREHQPDVLLRTGLSGAWVASAVGAVRRTPNVVVAHGSEFGMKKSITGG